MRLCKESVTLYPEHFRLDPRCRNPDSSRDDWIFVVFALLTSKIVQFREDFISFSSSTSEGSRAASLGVAR